MRDMRPGSRDYTRKSLVYENLCAVCTKGARGKEEIVRSNPDVPSIYVVETSHTIFERANEHWGAAKVDDKCGVNNVTAGFESEVGEITVDTTVGEDDGGVAGMTADAAAGVRKGEVNDITRGTVDSTVDETAGAVDEATAGAAAEDVNEGHNW